MSRVNVKGVTPNYGCAGTASKPYQVIEHLDAEITDGLFDNHYARSYQTLIPATVETQEHPAQFAPKVAAGSSDGGFSVV